MQRAGPHPERRLGIKQLKEFIGIPVRPGILLSEGRWQPAAQLSSCVAAGQRPRENRMSAKPNRYAPFPLPPPPGPTALGWEPAATVTSSPTERRRFRRPEHLRCESREQPANRVCQCDIKT